MNLDLRFYFKLLLRRLPVMLALILIGAGVGGVTAMKLPPEYSSSASLLVEAPQIPDHLAASTVQTKAIEQLEVVEKRLLTRANLIDVAHKFNAFDASIRSDPDKLVEAMRKATRIRRQGGRDRATLMTIQFDSKSATTAANVVNEFVTLVLEANNDFRISRAERTLEFFEQEVQRLSLDMDKKSAEIVSFRDENNDALPEALEYRLGRQTLLQERLERLERDQAGAAAQRQDIIRLFETTGRIRQQPTQALSPEEQQLAELRRELEAALVVYSPTNPRITMLERRIEQMEQTLPASQSEGGEDGDVTDQREALLQVSLSEVDTRIQLIGAEISSITDEIAQLEKNIRQASANAVALRTLERDFENLQARYNQAINNLNQASMGERIEVTSQGERITVVESASVPTQPSGPNRLKIAAAGVGAGLGAAGAFFALLELLNRTIRRPIELTNRFEITPIATLPYMESRRERTVRRGLLVTATLIVLLGVPAGLWYVDTHFMPLDLLMSKIVTRLGLT